MAFLIRSSGCSFFVCLFVLYIAGVLFVCLFVFSQHLRYQSHFRSVFLSFAVDE